MISDQPDLPVINNVYNSEFSKFAVGVLAESLVAWKNRKTTLGECWIEEE